MERLDQISYLKCALEARIDCSERTFSAPTSQKSSSRGFTSGYPLRASSMRIYLLRASLMRSTLGKTNTINVSSDTTKPITTEAGR